MVGCRWVFCAGKRRIKDKGHRFALASLISQKKSGNIKKAACRSGLFLSNRIEQFFQKSIVPQQERHVGERDNAKDQRPIRPIAALQRQRNRFGDCRDTEHNQQNSGILGRPCEQSRLLFGCGIDKRPDAHKQQRHGANNIGQQPRQLPVLLKQGQQQSCVANDRDY